MHYDNFFWRPGVKNGLAWEVTVFLTASAEVGRSCLFWKIRLQTFRLLDFVCVCSDNSLFLRMSHFFSMLFLQLKCGCVLSIICPRNGNRNCFFRIVNIIPQTQQERCIVHVVAPWYIYFKWNILGEVVQWGVLKVFYLHGCLTLSALIYKSVDSGTLTKY